MEDSNWGSADSTIQDPEERRVLYAALDSFRWAIYTILLYALPLV